MSQGRKPLGPALVEHLEGSRQAKQRLEVILATITGQMPIDAACQRLGIHQARFYRLRTAVLLAGLAELEPRPRGRPPEAITPEAHRLAELEQQVESLQSEIKLAAVREEIAQTMPYLADGSAFGKKTNPRAERKRRQRAAHRRRRAR